MADAHHLHSLLYDPANPCVSQEFLGRLNRDPAAGYYLLMAESTSHKLYGKDKRSQSFGPLIALTRHVKDDGRALIVYERRREKDVPAEERRT
jgi:hypothetical protein